MTRLFRFMYRYLPRAWLVDIARWAQQEIAWEDERRSRILMSRWEAEGHFDHYTNRTGWSGDPKAAIKIPRDQEKRKGFL